MPDKRRLIPLGEGLYTVAEVCRILQPGMTRHKVHYWLNTGLLSEPPVAHRGTGVPTLLSFKQLLEVRTAQRMRDDLAVTLARVREAFGWVKTTLFAESPSSVTFENSRSGLVIARADNGLTFEIPTNQGVLDIDLADLNKVVETSREAWEDRAFVIPGHPRVVANARIMNGSPTVQGTRIETSLLAAFADRDRTYTEHTLEIIAETYPRLDLRAASDALEFEGVRRAS